MQLRSTFLIAATALLSVAAAAAAIPSAPRAPVDPRFVGIPVDSPAPAIGFTYPGELGRVAALRQSPRRQREPRNHPEPRRYFEERGRRPPVVTQLSAGLYSPGGPSATSFLLSARAGPQVDPQVQVGFMIDWAHKEDRVSATFGHETVGGVDLSFDDSRLRGRSDLVPLLAFVQVGGGGSTRWIPYAGVAAGYEFLAMEAERPDGTRFDGTFGGWGWQLWAGAALPFSSRARLSGEIFLNRVDLGRDVKVYDRVLRQTASFNGPGLRVGVAWGF
jgi:hypothetical protein